tara:strand:- start:1962 stop:2228 length:267 start_codon:yes stop_codon:yes gene_type:complete
MALIKCNECGKEISDKATTCPNCGSPTVFAEKEKNAKEENTQVIAFICGIAVLIACAVGYAKYQKYCEYYPSKPFAGLVKCPEKSFWD